MEGAWSHETGLAVETRRTKEAEIQVSLVVVRLYRAVVNVGIDRLLQPYRALLPPTKLDQTAQCRCKV